MTLTLRDWASGNSLLHRMDARWKLVALFPVACFIVAVPHWTLAGLTFLVSLAWLRYAGLPWKWLISRLASVAGFLMIVGLVLPVSIPAEGWSFGPVRFSYRGVEIAALVVLRVLTVTSLGLLLLATTPLDCLARGLLGLGLPQVLVQILTMSLRYVYLLGAELSRIRLALRARGYQRGFSPHSYRTTAYVLGSLLLRSQERAERVAQAMRCRAFAGQLRLLSVPGNHLGDVLLALLLVVSLSLLPWLVLQCIQRF
ncbi:MAG: cobalt ECF transporter T component CbiQ [Gemmatales bacterium]|nr:cobalt ECF transporter T component CbiQ [Gemmatales bacterium]MDW7994520.1 cobalt ECF transporter T component CbiQ [Gemmatales bacterium]